MGRTWGDVWEKQVGQPLEGRKGWWESQQGSGHPPEFAIVRCPGFPQLLIFSYSGFPAPPPLQLLLRWHTVVHLIRTLTSHKGLSGVCCWGWCSSSAASWGLCTSHPSDSLSPGRLVLIAVLTSDILLPRAGRKETVWELGSPPFARKHPFMSRDQLLERLQR